MKPQLGNNNKKVIQLEAGRGLARTIISELLKPYRYL